MNIHFVREALFGFYPDKKCRIPDTGEGFIFGDIIWEGTPPLVDESAVISKITELQAEYDAQEYARERATSYPSVGDQLDMMMKDMKNGTTTHQEACEAVKAKYPKP